MSMTESTRPSDRRRSPAGTSSPGSALAGFGRLPRRVRHAGPAPGRSGDAPAGAAGRQRQRPPATAPTGGGD